MIDFRQIRAIRRWAPLIAVSLACAAFAQDAPSSKPAEPPAPTLKVGDKAPPLAIEKWVKGGPVAAFESGKFYVVEFWATWCGPCIRGMPHLSEIQHEYGPKGVTVIGCTAADRNGNSLEGVEKMVAEKGDGMAYTVAWDREATTKTAYMTAANQRGIPTCFVVDAAGNVAWIGHPMFLEFALDPILAGKWSYADGPAALKKDTDAAMQLVGGIRQKAGSNAAEAEADWTTLSTKYPGLAKQMPDLRIEVLLAAGKSDDAKKAAEEMIVKATKGKNVGELMNVVRIFSNPQRPADKGLLTVAFSAATKADELSGGKDAGVLEALARVHYLSGDLTAAIEKQTKAVELASERMKPRFEKTLEEYKKKAADGK
ncbi:MAG: redoxin family protein [Planctomycetes bacterium]|nr:redoxin family protein [Planctomycetota bacterium]